MEILSGIQSCRHTKDDKLLELAGDCRANRILCGDRELLVLSHFRGIPVVNPTQYLTEG
jgi:predicted nucleic acid-binding protein